MSDYVDFIRKIFYFIILKRVKRVDVKYTARNPTSQYSGNVISLKLDTDIR